MSNNVVPPDPKDFIQELRETLVPFNPDFDMINMSVNWHTADKYFDGQLVRDAIDQLDKTMTMAVLGEKPNALERLAVAFLLRSAGFERSQDPENPEGS